MIDERIRFVWPISERGYEIVQGTRVTSTESLATTHDEVTVITSGVVHIRDSLERKYEPLKQHTGLFRMFAETEKNEAGVKGFANSFGLLGLPSIEIEAKSRRGGNTVLQSGELVDDWIGNIQEMADAVTAWESIRTKRDGPDRAKTAQTLTREIGSHLLGNVSVSFDLESESEQPMVLLEPDNLLSAMWLQLASALEQGKRFRRCKYCNNWFEINPGTSRSDRQYCSDSCRYKAYRERKSSNE